MKLFSKSISTLLVTVSFAVRGMVTTECSARAKRSLAVLVGNVCDSRCRHK